MELAGKRLAQLKDMCTFAPLLAGASIYDGGRSSVVEQRIVVPSVVGSSPIVHPNHSERPFQYRIGAVFSFYRSVSYVDLLFLLLFYLCKTGCNRLAVYGRVHCLSGCPSFPIERAITQLSHDEEDKNSV